MNAQQPRIPEPIIQAAYPGAALTWIAAGGQSDVWRAEWPARDEALRVIVRPVARRRSPPLCESLRRSFR